MLGRGGLTWLLQTLHADYVAAALHPWNRSSPHSANFDKAPCRVRTPSRLCWWLGAEWNREGDQPIGGGQLREGCGVAVKINLKSERSLDASSQSQLAPLF